MKPCMPCWPRLLAASARVMREMVGQVATDAGITPEELARRAEFLLACLILPRAGTYYEDARRRPQRRSRRDPPTLGRR